MKQLKPAIQDAADRINDDMVANNVDAIKAMVIIDRITKDAIREHAIQKETITNSKGNNRTIVTGDDIRKEMNREIGE